MSVEILRPAASLLMADPTSYGQLDRTAQIERMTLMAEAALSAHALDRPRLVLLEHKKNTTFKVESGDKGDTDECYLLRICRPDAYTEEEVRSELSWLMSLRHEAGLLVPEPVPTRDGALLAVVELEGVPEPRCCPLFRWVPGRIVGFGVDIATFSQVGELLAKLHRHVERGVFPPGFTRPRWDCDRLFGSPEVIPADKGHELLSMRDREVLAEAAQVVRAQIASLPEDPELFGLIHSDLEPDNTVYHEGGVYAIDFADCGWGYYLYDIAASLLPLGDRQGFPAKRAAFLEGYRRVRPLAPELDGLLQTFLVARSLFGMRGIVSDYRDDPRLRDYAPIAVPYILGEVRRFLEQERRPARGRFGEQAIGKTATTVQLLAHLRGLGIKLWSDGDRLCFQAPKDALRPALRAELTARKAELLAFLRQAAAPPRPGPPAGQLIARDQPLPLSYAQQRLWFFDQLEPGSPIYNIPAGLRLSGVLDVRALVRSLCEIVVRHESLRTTFTAVREQPTQVIAASPAFQLPVLDLSALLPSERQAELERRQREEALRPFDLVQGPLLRSALLRLGEQEHVLLLSMHHIVSDGWSIGVLFRELAVLYQAFHAGEPSPLPPLLLQYADFAWWQRQWLQGEVLEAQLAYWKRQLEGAEGTLDLPADRPRLSLGTYRGSSRPLALSSRLGAELSSLCQQRGATLFMGLLAAFRALLFRLTGQEDVLIGSPIANRNRAEIEGLIGFFVNTLVLRTPVTPDSTFLELLERERQTTLGAYAHQDLPFEKLIEQLHPERDAGHTPLVQVLFVLQNAPIPDVRMPGLTLSQLPTVRSTATFDLTFSLQETRDGLRGGLRYRADLFDAATIDRMAAHFANLLAGVVVRPDLRVSGLPLLTSAERQQTLIEWNDTATAYPRSATIHTLFARQAALAPDAVAITSGKGALSYGELDRRSERLARRLAALGLGPEELVGICLERSPRMVLALLAVLKAGGAYLPLDPAYPRDRLSFLLADTGARIVLTETDLAPVLPESPARSIFLDQESTELPEEHSPQGSSAGGLAYAMYTSGSTGRPKAVAVTHGNVVRLVQGADYAAMGKDEVFLHFAPISFDASTLELWGPLLNGGRLALFPADRPALEELGEELRRQGVTTLWLTAGLFREMVEGSIAGLTGLRQLLAGGDALSAPHVRRVLAEMPGCTLVNGYGPTEGTTFTCCFRLSTPDRVGETVPIGRPISNARVYLLDRSLQPVPAAVPAELVIGGDGLARGYLGRPDLTAERFIPDPFAGAAGGRLYRTGDLVRYHADGTLEFLGRIDRQVKIRGFRIEPAEVEAALSECPGVRGCAVVVDRNPREQKRLVAYVVAAPERPMTTAELRAAMRRRLPDYMIPAVFVLLEELPLTPNGKIDRRSLPSPSGRQAGEQPGATAPRTPVEELIAQMWSEILDLPAVGVDDNFFDLGGHSLLATRLVSRLRETFRCELPLRRLFEAPTVAALARVLAAARRQEVSPQAPPLVPVLRDQPLRLSFAQERIWFLDRLDPGNPAYNMPVSVRLRGDLDLPAFAGALHEIVRRHEILRTTFAPPTEGGDGWPSQVILPHLPALLGLLDLTALPRSEDEAARLAREEAARPFDLGTGPLIRARLVRLRRDEHLLLWNMHHVISDGWSMGVLFRELTTLYGALLRGEPSPLPELSIQYVDFACWQRHYLQGEILARELSYWRGQLSEAPQTCDLFAASRSHSARRRFRGGSFVRELPADLAASLKAVGREEGVTLAMILQALLGALFHRLSGEEHIAIGSPIAGRVRAEVESLIGIFLNTLVLRCDLSGDPDLRELLRRCREVALDAYAHQEVPFEKLLEELQPKRDLRRTPLFQVFLNVLNFPSYDADLPGLRFEVLTPPEIPSKFDLSVYVSEQQGAIRLGWVYDADLLSGDRIAVMAGQLETLAAQMLTRPDAGISWHSLLTPETAGLLPDLSAELPVTWVGAVCDRFSSMARRVPGRRAISAPEGAWTYGELEEQSNRLAHFLIAHRLGREDVVALFAHRSASLVCALLGVLKAGAAFLILDAAYPGTRLAQAFRQAQPRGWLQMASAGPVPSLLADLAAPLACFLELPAVQPEEFLAEFPASPPGITVGPQDLAYVAFTSGSTGTPKGILGEHRPLSHFLAWHCATFGLRSCDRVSLLSGLSHDPLLRDVFTPLWMGGALAIPDPDLLRRPTELLAWLRREEISVVHLTPALGELLADAADQNNPDLPDLRFAFFGGGVLPRRLVNRFRRLAPGAVCVNFYGTTETPQAMAWALADGAGEEGAVPVGRGIEGAQVLVLTRLLQPAGLGERGEICIRSPYLSRGYLAASAAAGERFVPNPLTGDSGDRLYRTGDFGRYGLDASIEILGRGDDQVQIQGYRVELGEVEATLVRHPGVRQAAVRLWEEREGPPVFAAYFTTPPGRQLTPGELRRFLSQQLPAPMIPSLFIQLDALPLTPNGKFDRRVLPPPCERHPGRARFDAPRDAVELALVQIWEELLGIDPIGIRDDFFDLGGHSLLTVLLTMRIRSRLGADLPVSALFESPTIEQLAARLRRGGPERRGVLVPLNRGRSRRAFFCVHPVGGNIFCYTKLARKLGREQPFYGLQVPDALVHAPGRIEQMAAHYLSSLRAVQPRGPYLLGGWSMGGVVAFEMARQLLDGGERVDLLALLDCRVPDPGRVPDEVDERTVLAGFARDLAGLVGREPSHIEEELAPLARGEELSLVVERASSLGLLPGDTDLHRTHTLLRIFRANLLALHSYVPTPYDGRLDLFPTAKSQQEAGDPALGWTALARSICIHPLPGDHYSILAGEALEILATRLHACLVQADTRED